MLEWELPQAISLQFISQVSFISEEFSNLTGKMMQDHVCNIESSVSVVSFIVNPGLIVLLDVLGHELSQSEFWKTERPWHEKLRNSEPQPNIQLERAIYFICSFLNSFCTTLEDHLFHLSHCIQISCGICSFIKPSCENVFFARNFLLPFSFVIIFSDKPS